MSQFRKNLPLQEMIRSVVSSATEKLAADQNAERRIKTAMDSSEKTEKEKTASQDDGFTNPSYVEKLASACDFISQNVDNIEAPNRGVLGQALAKLGGESVAPAVVTPDQLEVTTGMSGTQKYKHDKPKGEDAAESTANTPEGKAGLPGGATQMKNDMDSAPGQNSGSVPTATYPADGPLHAGPAKTAGLAALANSLLSDETEKTAGKLDAVKGVADRYGQLMRGGKKIPHMVGNRVHENTRAGNTLAAVKNKNLRGEAAKSLGARAGTAGAAGLGVAALKGNKEKTAAEIAKENILRKLAGEDVMKAQTSSSKSGGPLVGDGEMDALTAEEVPSNATDGSGYGNQQRHLVGGNQAAIDYTKADAKKPRVKELKEVLETPAFDPGADTKLREQLRNAGSAGVKIAGANARELLKQAAARGVLKQETVNQFKELRKQAQMGADMASSPAGDGMEATAGEPQNPKVAKLKSMMQAKKQSMVGGMGYEQEPPPSGGM